MGRAQARAVFRATPWWSTRTSSTCSGASSASAMTRKPRSGCLTSRRTRGASTKPPEAWPPPRGAGVTQLWCTETVSTSTEDTRSVARSRVLSKSLMSRVKDLRGSSSELWAFHLPSETWHLVSQGQGAGQGACQVPPKHHHSAVIHNDAMWVFGGMSDLHERSDCWKFDFGEQNLITCQRRKGPTVRILI